MGKNKRFEVVYQQSGFLGDKIIYVDKETGVNYLFVSYGFGGGGLTPLLDAAGKPVITKNDSITADLSDEK